MTDSIMKAANQIIWTFVTDRKCRLENGARFRAEMVKTLNRGEVPTGYRVEWIADTTTALFALLSEKAREFNELHPQDAVSISDLMDVLTTAMAKLRNS